MSRIKSAEESTRRWVRNSLRAYLEYESKCTLNWIKGIIKQSGIEREELKEIFDSLKDYGNQQKYKGIYEICESSGFNSDAVD